MHAYDTIIPPQVPIPLPIIMPPSPMLSLIFNPQELFVPEELLPPKKQVSNLTSSSTDLSIPSQEQACILVPPSFLVYTPTPPRIFEIGKSSIKMHLKHHEKQIEDILNYLEELSFHRIEKMEKRLVNGWMTIQRYFDELKTKLEKNGSQKNINICSTSHELGCHPATIDDHVATDLEAQATNMANTNNKNRNPEPRETHAARKCTYKEFTSCQPFYFNSTEGAVGLIRWFERTELVFSHSNCTEDFKVKFATGGLPRSIEGNVTASKPQTLEEAINITQSDGNDKVVMWYQEPRFGLEFVWWIPGSESHPPMLNKENYVPWSSRLLRYAKSRPNGKLIHNSILNGPYVRRMIPEPGDANREVTTILLGLHEDIYPAVDSCETAQEIWLRPEWSRHVTIVHRTKDLHTADYTQLYDFLKYNQKESYLQQPMPNPKDIIDPPTVMNMALPLMAKAFKLNYSTPTNNNKRISSNPRNRQIAQPGMNMGQDRQMQMVGGNGGNQFRQYAGQNAENTVGYNDVIRNQVIQNAIQNPRVQNVGNQNGLIGVQGNGNQNQIGNEVNANCILMANLQQPSTSGTQTDSAPIYDSDGSTEVYENRDANCDENCDDNEIFNMFTQEEQYTELLEPIPESHQVPQNDNDVISEDTSVEQGGGNSRTTSCKF
uniref:Reverse transcriptase domain-containing protein n=1 Tax=Tanacetum cinerariifolium TaxID=118510 RepID=A0A699H0W2_TANCI|nr:reverse transcriptase domain-containing protein [Tanacetum cinerariifolium]